MRKFTYSISAHLGVSVWDHTIVGGGESASLSAAAVFKGMLIVAVLSSTRLAGSPCWGGRKALVCHHGLTKRGEKGADVRTSAPLYTDTNPSKD